MSPSCRARALLAAAAAAAAVARAPPALAAAAAPAAVTVTGCAVLGGGGGVGWAPTAGAGAPPPPGALACGAFTASLNETGWSVLDIAAVSGGGGGAGGNDTLTAYAAGFVEGFLTAPAMAEFVRNTGADAPNSKKLQAFLDANLAWMDAAVASSGASAPGVGDAAYWAHVGALLAQVRGMVAGQAAAGGRLGWLEVYNAIIQGGDIFNLAQVYGVSAAQAAARGGPARRLAAAGRARVEGAAAPRASASAPRRGRADHCSAVVRSLPGYADVVFAHTTWSGLENMHRVLKRFDLPFAAINGGEPVPGRHVALSSYPAYGPYSSDDFYVMSSGLVAVETTIDNDNATLAEEYKSVAVVLEWARNVVANRLARDGAGWAATFSVAASGTYTNSWMILDTSKTAPGAPPAAGALTVLEEMPGHIRVADRTAALRFEGPDGASGGYWASYNVPSDEYIFNISGQQALVDEYGGPAGAGAFFTYANTSRANIFRRDAPRASDEAGVRRLIRYNDFEHDPLSTLGCGAHPPYSPVNAIADRSDLGVKRKDGDFAIPDLAGGDSAGIDAKLTRASWMRAPGVPGGGLPFAAVAGPTTDQQPVFAWATATIDKKVPHEGLPPAFNFTWIRQPWAA